VNVGYSLCAAVRVSGWWVSMGFVWVMHVLGGSCGISWGGRWVVLGGSFGYGAHVVHWAGVVAGCIVVCLI